MSTLKVNNVTDLGLDAVVTNGVIVPSALPAGSILQVVSTTLTTTFSATVADGGETDLTGLSASITPSATSSKIMVFASVSGMMQDGADKMSGVTFKIVRDSTDILVGTSVSSRTPITTSQVGLTGSSVIIGSSAAQGFDSPSSTSSLTYKIVLPNIARGQGGSINFYINRSQLDSDNPYSGRSISSLTLMEVAA